MIRLVLATALLLAAPLPAEDSLASLKIDQASNEPLFRGMGPYHRTIKTSSAAAAQYFNQGLIFLYGYNYAESVRSFRAAERLDPRCAICYWGEALALSEAANAFGAKTVCAPANAALQQAKSLSSEASPIEQALIEALAKRFRYHADSCTLDNTGYANGMKKVYQAYPKDPDVAALYVDAEMGVVDMSQDMREGHPTGYTKELLKTLETGMAQYPYHPGLNHFAIHAYEECGLPQKALEAAQRLDNLVPTCGHLQHMPAHIYYAVGRYGDATAANLRGIAADEALFRQGGVKVPQMAAFYLHNYFYLFRSLVMEGKAGEAIQQSQQLISKLDTGYLPSTPYYDDLFHSVPFLLMARFGQWNALAQATPPSNTRPFSLAMWHYSQGIAALHKGEATAAERELKLLKNQEQNVNFKRLKPIVTLAILHLSGEIAGNQGESQRQRNFLSQAAQLQQQLHLDMLPWYVPIHH